MISEEVLPDKVTCARSLNHIIDALYVIGGKWKLPLILVLMEKPRRFNELLKEVPGISPKVLAKELKDLELNDFVTRHQSDSPVQVIYTVTDYSNSLKTVMGELSQWGQKHREKMRDYFRQ
jgi:DNA-binding HxlR family transcriptional regulator